MPAEDPKIFSAGCSGSTRSSLSRTISPISPGHLSAEPRATRISVPGSSAGIGRQIGNLHESQEVHHIGWSGRVDVNDSKVNLAIFPNKQGASQTTYLERRRLLWLDPWSKFCLQSGLCQGCPWRRTWNCFEPNQRVPAMKLQHCSLHSTDICLRMSTAEGPIMVLVMPHKSAQSRVSIIDRVNRHHKAIEVIPPRKRGGGD